MTVKDLTVSFPKSRRAISGTLNKLQIPALNDCWEGNGKLPSVNFAKRQDSSTVNGMTAEHHVLVHVKIIPHKHMLQCILSHSATRIPFSKPYPCERALWLPEGQLRKVLLSYVLQALKQ